MLQGQLEDAVQQSVVLADGPGAQLFAGLVDPDLDVGRHDAAHGQVPKGGLEMLVDVGAVGGTGRDLKPLGGRPVRLVDEPLEGHLRRIGRHPLSALGFDLALVGDLLRLALGGVAALLVPLAVAAQVAGVVARGPVLQGLPLRVRHGCALRAAVWGLLPIRSPRSLRHSTDIRCHSLPVIMPLTCGYAPKHGRLEA